MAGDGQFVTHLNLRKLRLYLVASYLSDLCDPCIGLQRNRMTSVTLSSLMIGTVTMAFIGACSLSFATESRAQATLPSRFDFAGEVQKTRLNYELKETSALTVDKDGQIWTLQDERGHVYSVDPGTGEILRQHKFDGRGDFEGLEAVGDHLFALRSDGRLFRMNRRNPAPETTDQIKLDLPRGCDSEGLEWHEAIERFLIVCKEADGVSNSKGRAIYAFKQNGERDGKEPYFYVSEDELTALGHRHGIGAFKPSALAIDPVSGAHYMLSSTRPGIMIWTNEGAMFTGLDVDDMRQPEGIAFDQEGNLLITSEAKGGHAHMYLFEPVTQPSEKK